MPNKYTKYTTTECHRCGTKFQAVVRENIKKYCSPECRANKPEPKRCLHCGKEYTLERNGDHRKSKFCSHDCANAYRVGRPRADKVPKE